MSVRRRRYPQDISAAEHAPQCRQTGERIYLIWDFHLTARPRSLWGLPQELQLKTVCRICGTTPSLCLGMRAFSTLEKPSARGRYRYPALFLPARAMRTSSTKDSIIAWLNPDNGLCPLTLDGAGTGVFRKAERGFSFDKAVRNSTFDLAFLCPNPYAYAATDETYDIGSVGTHTVSRSGNLTPACVFAFGCYPIRHRHLHHDNLNGSELRIVGKLSAGETLVIDSALMTARWWTKWRYAPKRSAALVGLNFPLVWAQTRSRSLSRKLRDLCRLQISAGRWSDYGTQKYDEHAGRFTGQIPSAWGKDGLWRFNESDPDENTARRTLREQA